MSDSILLSLEQQRDIIHGKQTVLISAIKLYGEYPMSDINGESLGAVNMTSPNTAEYWSKLTQEQQRFIAEGYGYDSIPAFRQSAKRLGLEKMIEDLRPFYICSIEAVVSDSLPTPDETSASLETEVDEAAEIDGLPTPDSDVDELSDVATSTALVPLTDPDIVDAEYAEVPEPVTVAFGLPDRVYRAQVTAISAKIDSSTQSTTLTIDLAVTPDDLAGNGLVSAAFATNDDGQQIAVAGEQVKLSTQKTAGYSLLIAPEIDGKPCVYTEYVPDKLTLTTIEPQSGLLAALRFKAAGLPYNVAGQRWTGIWLLQFIAKPVTAESQVDDRQTSIEDFTGEGGAE